MTLASNFRPYGQTETLISSIRNIIRDYPFEFIFKEFLQNADDAGAKRFHVIIDDRSHTTKSLLCDGMKAWQGPAILIFNDAKFKESDFESLMKIRVGGKQDDDTKLGKHGLGFNSCYHFTDVPSFISGDSIAFLDPQEKFLPMENRGIIGLFPKNGNRNFSYKGQYVPYEGIEGFNFRSTFDGTLFRIPLRQQPSEISDKIFLVKEVRDLFTEIKSNVTSQFLFLRNIEEIKVSHIQDMSCFQINSLWTATLNGIDESTRSKRKHIMNGDVQTFQLEIELIDDSNNVQNEQWIVVTGAQNNPDDPELQGYAKRYRLRVLGGIAALLKSKKNNNDLDERMYPSILSFQQRSPQNLFASLNYPNCTAMPEDEEPEFKGRLFSTFSLPDTTYLSVHLNGTWAQGSDRARLLIEKDNSLPDMDHQKLNWNRHILLEFLPDLHCKLLEEITKLQNDKKTDFKNYISKFWPFPLATYDYPNYVFDYGCRVLQCILQSETIFRLIDSDYFYQHCGKVYLYDENNPNHVDILFKCLSTSDISNFYLLLRNYWDGAGVPLESLIRELPIWPVRYPSMTNHSLSYAPVSVGYVLPKNFNMYRPKGDKIFLRVNDKLDFKILSDLGAIEHDVQDYALNDVELPEESDLEYINFLDSVLNNVSEYHFGYECNLIKLKEFKFPNAVTSDLMPISELFDYNNIVFRTVFGRDANVFLHHNLENHKSKLSYIGFNDELNSVTFDRCISKIEELQMDNPPPDLRHRGFTLIDHFYKNVEKLNLREIYRIPFIPITKFMDKPYDKYYNHPEILDCFNNIILPQYKSVAWSQKALFAEDVIPPPDVLEVYPLLGKPTDITVIKHLKFLRKELIDDEEWRDNWKETFISNVFDVYDWLNKKCSDEGLRLREHIKMNVPLFLNLFENQDPFDTDNWVSARNLVLNAEPNEDKYISPRLEKYYAMLKSVGVPEIKAPDFKIHVRKHDQSFVNKSALLEMLANQGNTFHDVVFNVKGEKIWASRIVLAASSKSFHREFTSGKVEINIYDVSPTSVRILLDYLYGQKIDDAIDKHHDTTNQTSIFGPYDELLMLANEYKLDHLKDLMELKLSRKVTRLNMNDIKNLANSLSAGKLEGYCDRYIYENGNF